MAMNHRRNEQCKCWVKYVSDANRALAQEPKLYRALIRECKRLVDSGYTSFSLGLPWTKLRYDPAYAAGYDEFGFTLNNNLKAPIQRMIIGDK
jgi:hypothetical protein